MKAKYAKLVGIGFLLFFSFRFLLPLVLPFVLAYFFAKSVAPVIAFLEKKMRWNHRISVVLVVGIVFLTLGVFVVYVGTLAVRQGIALLQKLPVYQQMFGVILEKMCCQCDNVFDLEVGTSYQYVETQVENWCRDMGSHVLPQVSTYVSQILQRVITIGGFFFIFIVSTILILLDTHFPRLRGRMRVFAVRLQYAGFAYLKSQGIILFIIAVVITLGLFLINNEYAVIGGLGIAIFDAFPVVGSGIILIPWGMIRLIGGDYYAAAILITVFALTSFLREVLEPKLFGKELGMKPLYILMAVYVGMKLFGLSGVVLGPVGLTILKVAKEEI